MDATKDDMARRLADAHLAVEPGIARVVRLRADDESDPDEPLKMLEVNRHTFAAGIRPVYFPPSARHGIPFTTAIVEVTPEEFERIEAGALALPDGWKMSEIILPRAVKKVS